MRATVLQESLNRGLTTVSKVISARGQLPILSNVLIESLSEGIVLTATNLDMGMRVAIGGKVEKTGAITVPARNLADFVATLTGETVELAEEASKLKVKAGKYGATLAGISALEFPTVIGKTDKDGDGQKFKLSKAIISEIAVEVAYAAAVDDSRPVLTGVKWGVRDREMTATATDGFRMSKKIVSSKLSVVGNLDSLILPARAILELSRIVSDGKKEEVEMVVYPSSNQVVFGYDKTELICRVLEGNFPDIDRVIPKEEKTVVLVDHGALAKAMKAVAVFARDSGNIIKLKTQDSRLKIQSSSSQMGDSEAEVDVDVEGDDVEISFNYKFMNDFLNSVDPGRRVKIILNGNMVAGVWKSEGNESLTHLIMPIRN